MKPRNQPQNLSSGVGNKQASPRARRSSHETKGGPSANIGSASTSFSASSQHLRSAGGSSAFGPVRHDEFANDEEQQPTNRDLYFLGAAEKPSTLKPHHSRGGSDCEYETLLQLVPGGNRGTSPNTVPQNTITRPIRPTMRQTYVQSPQTEPIASEPPLVTSRPNSPAGIRPQSPTSGSAVIRQPTSPQLAAMRAPSPTTVSNTAPFRPQSPPQIAAGIRPRSQSLDSKGGVANPLPARPQGMGARPMPVTAGPAYPASIQGSILGGGKPGVKPMALPARPVPANAIKQAPPSVLAQAQPSAMQSIRPSNTTTSQVQTLRETPSSATNSPIPTSHIQLGPDLLSALSSGDTSAITDDQLDTLTSFLTSVREQRRRTTTSTPSSQYPVDAGTKSGRTHRPKEDSHDELSHYLQNMDDPNWNQFRQRGSSQDGGRQAPNLKMFESQIPGEETRGTPERKPPSPYPWYLNAPAHAPLRDPSAYLKSQPRPAVYTDAQSIAAATPDLSRSVEIYSAGSAFTASASQSGESEDEVKLEDPLTG